MLALFSLMLNVAVIGGIALILASSYKLYTHITTRRNFKKTQWETYTKTVGGRVIVGIQRRDGSSALPERQELYELPIASLTSDPDLLHTKRAYADETAAVLNMRED